MTKLLEVLPGARPEMCQFICHGMWSVTPYAQCDFKCVYCCTSAQGESVAVDGLADASVEHIGELLAAVPSGDLLIFGAFSDAYPNVERDVGLTRRVLEVAVRQRWRVTIVTKGDTVLRDVDLLRQLDEALVQISICSTDDAALARLDPGAPSATERFAVIDELHAAGIPVELNALPWIPDVTDTDALLARLPDGVVANLSPLGFGPNDSMRLLGTTYTRAVVWERYLAEYERLGHLVTTSWVRPSLPPEENHPIDRLPQLDAPAAVSA